MQQQILENPIESLLPQPMQVQVTPEQKFEDVKVEFYEEENIINFCKPTYDKQILCQIEECGYPTDFVVRCLQQKQLNYATAFYNLATSEFEY